MDDRELLQDFMAYGAEVAFTGLVERYAGLVYSTARRMVGDGDLAKDVAQTVFLELARRPGAVRTPEALAGWLYRATRFAGAKLMRTEQRRRLRETEAVRRTELENPPAGWEDIRPLLEEAMGRLGRQDHDALVLRYFEGKSLEETGRALDLTDKAVSQRVARALEKLRGHFARRGVTVAAALVAEAVAANAVQAAPAGLAMTLSTTALAGAGSAGTAGFFGKIFAMTTKTKILAVVAVVVLAASVVWQQQKIVQLNMELAAAQNALVLKRRAATDAGKTVQPSLTQILNESGSDALKAARDALSYVEKLKPGDIRGALEALNRRPPWNGSNDTTLVRNLLLARWAQSDPRTALAWIKTRDPDHRGGDYTELFQAWVKVDPEGALTGLKAINSQWDKVDAAGWMLGSLAETDPQTALHLLAEMPANEQHAGLRYRMFGLWAMADPTGAAAAAMAIPPGFAREAALEGTARSWAIKDPQAALAWAATMNDYSTQYDVFGNALGQMSNDDPVAAARYVENMPPGELRTGSIAGVAENWAQTDPQAALAWAGKMATGQIYDEAVKKILGQMAQSDPAGTAAVIAQMPDATTRAGAITQLADQWAQNDFSGAMAWVQGLPASEGTARSDALKNVMKNWDDTDPAGAAAYLAQNLTNDPAYNILAEQLAGHWATADAQSALAWAEALPPGSLADNATTMALTSLAKSDPQAAWEKAAQITDAKAQAQAMAGVVKSWSAQNPAQAAAVFNQIPDGAQQVEAATTLATAWVAQDPTAASQWIRTLPNGDARDAAVTKLIAAEGANDPATAFNWAKSIGNADSQQTQLNNVVSTWAKTNAAAATAAVEAAGLTDTQKAALLKTVQAAGSGK